MLDALTHDSFSPCVGDMFFADVGGAAPVSLVLTRVEPRAMINGAPTVRRAFSLIFDGPGPDRLPQAVHRLRHHALGELDIFIVPVGATDGGFKYQAVFT